MKTFQDIFDEFYDGRSGGDRGTLFQIKNRFNHRNVSGKAIQTFNYNADLLRFTTEALTTLLGMQICAINNQTDMPGDLPDTDSQKEEYLEQVATKVVETVWCEVPQKDITSVLDAIEDPEEAQYYEYCFCKEGE